MFWLHHKFTGNLARLLGIPSALNSILNEMSNKNFLKGTEYGQCEDLCDRLNSILRKYPPDESIFKEFIQNADDAGASEIVFILDHRRFNSKDGELFSSDPEWKNLHQCPSLLVYNNKLMSEADIIGITKLGRGNKEFSPDLIGRFGIGFNVAYHITDCVTYVSYGPGAVPENFCVLDPSGLFAPGHRQAPLRGRRFEMDPLRCQQFSKEFDPFYNGEVFLRMSKLCDGCFSDISTSFRNGCVLFRLPFTRSISPPCETHLVSGFKMNSGCMKKLLKTLSHGAEDLVLFLNNIKHISAFEIQENGSCLHHFTTSISISTQDAAICTKHGRILNLEVKNLKNKLCASKGAGDSQGSNSDASHDIKSNSFHEICWGYQLAVQTVIHTSDAKNPQNSAVHKAVWFISQQFGSKQIPVHMLKAALSDGLIPKGGVAVQVNSSKETSFSLFCSLPLPIKSQMPVHINGNFWVDDSRKHLEFGAVRSLLTDWNCCLTNTVIAGAYVNALEHCKQFLPDKSTDWYYSNFPVQCSNSRLEYYPFSLYKIVYQKIFQGNLPILQQDTMSLTGSVSWLPVVGNGHGLFFPSDPTEDGQQILRKLLIEFGSKLSKAPLNIYEGIKLAASACKVEYNAIITPVIFIQLLKSLNLQQHRETIIKNVIILLKYCLSTEEGRNAITGAPLLLTYSGSLRQMSTVYGSQFAQLLPHKYDGFIHPELEKHDFIKDLSCYTRFPDVSYVSNNLQMQDQKVPVNVDKCPEIHAQVIELWKYLNTLLETVKPKHYALYLNKFYIKQIIPASNKTLVPICKGKMVLSPNYGGCVREIMKLFGHPMLDFSILCDTTFPTFAGALDKILTHCNDGNDILKCVELNDLSPVLPSNCDLAQYKVDLQVFLNFISTSLSTVQLLNTPSLCKLPIFETITGDICSIKELKNTYLIPNGVPLRGLKEVMTNSPMLILKNLPVYVKVYKCLKIYHCDIAQFYLEAIIPFLQTMNTKDIITHVKFLFQQDVDVQIKVSGALKASKFIYVAGLNKWCSASEFYDSRVELFQMSFPTDVFPSDKFPPQEWCSDELLDILHLLGLQRDLSWQVLFNMAKHVEYKVRQNIKEPDDKTHYQDICCESKRLLEFIHNKLTQVRNSVAMERSVDEALQFCRSISQIVFIPTHEDGCITKEVFGSTRKWTKFSAACFSSHFIITFFERDVITASFSLNQENEKMYIDALGIEDPPSCNTVMKNLLQLSQMTQSMIQSLSGKDPYHQHLAVKNDIKKLFDCHYTYFEKCLKEKSVTSRELCLLQDKECLFVETLTFFIVSSDCIVKTISEPLFPYLCRIPSGLTEHHEFIKALGICDEPNSWHYARVLEKIHHEFATSGKKLSNNSKYLNLASKACNYLVEMLSTEEANESIPENLSNMNLYLLDKQNELYKATDLAFDDVPWYSKRLQNVASYKYMKPLSQDTMPLPQTLGVKLLSGLVVEELEETILLPDNHCADERRALQRGQQHGCPFVLSLENLLSSSEFKLGVQRIIYHQKHGIDLTKREIALTNELCSFKFSCYYKIVTVLKQNDGQIIQGSSLQVYSVLCADADQNPLLCLAPHCDDKDAVVKELAQNINRYLSCVVQNESHLGAMIKCPSHLDIEAALDKCKVKSYTAADQSIQRLPSVGECVTPNITDLVIILNYNKGESVKYWNEDGKLVLAKVIAVKPQLLVDIKAKSLIICTSEGNDNAKIKTSPIFVSKYLQPSFLENWLSSEKKVMKCSGLLLYHYDDKCNPVVIQKEIIKSFKILSHHLINVIFKRLFFHLHFYLVKCNKCPEIFNKLSMRYFEEQVALYEQLQLPVRNEECDELSELFEDMCVYTSGEPDSENDANTCDKDMAGANPFENREFLEQDPDVDEFSDRSCYKQRNQNIHYRKPHLRKAADITGNTKSQRTQINRNSQSTDTQQALSRSTTLTNAFSQPVVHSVSSTGGLFRSSTGGYRSRAHHPRPTAASVWNQSTASRATTASSTNALPKTNVKTAFMWLQQAIADFNAAKHYVECSRYTKPKEAKITSRSHDKMEAETYPCQFPALVCFLSHEVVEKCLKAVYLAKCGTTLTNQCDLNLVALYDQLSTTRCWPLTDIKDFVLQVSEHNMRCRYPDHHVPPEAPCALYTDLDARHALAAAQEVFKKVCSIKCFKDKLPSQPSALPLLPSTVYLDPNSKF